eukprot:4895441-Ditylum_brightwellii.AAC.1
MNHVLCPVQRDEGYGHVPTKASTRNDLDSNKVKEFKHRTKASKHSLEKNKSALGACFVPVQYELGNGYQHLIKFQAAIVTALSNDYA